MTKKELYEKKIEGRLQELKDEISILKTRVDNAKTEVKLEYVNQLENLKNLEQIAEKNLDEFKNKSDDTWEKFKENIEESWDKLSCEITQLKKKFKENE
ncbi:hypothetical protein CP960_08670 [Malaciobacter halophilus]|uniref:Coiled coil domain-containing protein n=1 Tax=Malaciobacter halophilus TaxID=197482 RepID=A0A2N1J239_9BACT|nr:hypothetical protein [Malaciobacter halophilus]AXH10129.1 hypothetical protein AHALO_1764 [Malaciobacter halophilus]PKI80611.1 hypothetical protein CP960_08670 [Malaciobacter halophilus]